jgi:hypothetical protein
MYPFYYAVWRVSNEKRGWLKCLGTTHARGKICDLSEGSPVPLMLMFWVSKPCGLVDRYQRFVWTVCLFLESCWSVLTEVFLGFTRSFHCFEISYDCFHLSSSPHMTIFISFDVQYSKAVLLRHQGEAEYSSYSFLTSSLDGVSGQRHAQTALNPRGKDPRYPLDKGLVGPQSWPGHRG